MKKNIKELKSELVKIDTTAVLPESKREARKNAAKTIIPLLSLVGSVGFYLYASRSGS